MPGDTTRTLFTGATGLVGKKLLPHLDCPIVVTRDAQQAGQKLAGDNLEFIEWNSTKGSLDLSGHSPVHQVVNLMGAPIAGKRWNPERKRLIRESRVDGTRRLIDGLRQLPQLPDVFVSASAIGIYGDRADEILTESSSSGDDDFLVDVCREWEAEAMKLVELGVRVVVVRIGIVLSKQGGALKEMLPIFRWGVGGRLGSGKQWMSWIHVDDLKDILLFALQNESVSGVINGVAPEPVRNLEFTKTLGQQISRPTILPAPKFGLKLVLGEFAESLLASQRVIPDAIEALGFSFKHRQLQSALEAELSDSK